MYFCWGVAKPLTSLYLTVTIITQNSSVKKGKISHFAFSLMKNTYSSFYSASRQNDNNLLLGFCGVLHQVWADIAESFSMLLFNLNNPTAHSALWDPTNSHSGCWGVEREAALNQLWKYKRQHAYASGAWILCVCVFEGVYLLPQMWPSKLWFLLKYWACSLFEKEERDEGDFVSRFIGLAFRDWKNPEWKRRGGNVLNRREIKRRGKAFLSFFHTERSGVEKNKLICD